MPAGVIFAHRPTNSSRYVISFLTAFPAQLIGPPGGEEDLSLIAARPSQSRQNCPVVVPNGPRLNFRLFRIADRTASPTEASATLEGSGTGWKASEVMAGSPDEKEVIGVPAGEYSKMISPI